MSIDCLYTVMSPTASSAPSDQQPTRLNQRRNAMANVHDGISPSDISQIKEQAPACLTTARPTCLSTTGSTSSTATSSEANGLSAMALEATMPAGGQPSSPLQSPGLRRRRNAVPDVLAALDEGTLSRIRAASVNSDHEDDHQQSHQHDHQHECTF